MNYKCGPLVAHEGTASSTTDWSVMRNNFEQIKNKDIFFLNKTFLS